MRLAALVVTMVLATSALAQAGSQIRATPQVPQFPPRAAQKIEVGDMRCDRLKDDLRQRCLAEARQSALERKPVGPESIGVSASGAGAGSSSGTSGAAGSGGSAPR